MLIADGNNTKAIFPGEEGEALGFTPLLLPLRILTPIPGGGLCVCNAEDLHVMLGPKRRLHRNKSRRKQGTKMVPSNFLFFSRPEV